jgi:hypothetical protein
VEFGPAKNVIWKTSLPAGHSSPVLTADRIFVTASDADKLYVITLEERKSEIDCSNVRIEPMPPAPTGTRIS